MKVAGRWDTRSQITSQLEKEVIDPILQQALTWVSPFKRMENNHWGLLRTSAKTLQSMHDGPLLVQRPLPISRLNHSTW